MNSAFVYFLLFYLLRRLSYHYIYYDDVRRAYVAGFSMLMLIGSVIGSRVAGIYADRFIVLLTDV